MQKFKGLTEEEIIEILKEIITQEQMDVFLTKIESTIQSKQPNDSEKLLRTTSLYKLIIPTTYKRGLVRSAWNMLATVDSEGTLFEQIGYNPIVDKSNQIKIVRDKICTHEFEDIAYQYYKYFGASAAYDKINDNIISKDVYRVGHIGKKYIIEAYKLLREQLELLEPECGLGLTGDELLENNIRRSINNVEMNFEKIIELLNTKTEGNGKILLLSPNKELSMKKDHYVLETLAMYSDEATNNGYLSGYDGESGFTKLIRKI